MTRHNALTLMVAMMATIVAFTTGWTMLQLWTGVIEALSVVLDGRL